MTKARAALADESAPAKRCAKCKSPWIEVAGLFSHREACGGAPEFFADEGE
jgi:hypothetical protein